MLAAAAQAADSGHWVSTWATSPQEPRAFGPPRAGTARRAPAANARPLIGLPIASFHNQTIRMIAHTTIGGQRVRVELSNAFGTKPLDIGAAHIAMRDKDSSIVPASDRQLLFSGQPKFRIPVGAMVVSDPVDLDVPAGSDLAVSIYVPEAAAANTIHSVGLHTTYVSKEGDTSERAAMPDAITSESYYWLTNIDVDAAPDAAAIVAFGDSITDGATSTVDTNRSWPSFLARRLAAAGSNLAVLNQGISGNQLLRDGAGVNALARFDRDVLAQPGAKWLMVLEGINDIGISTRPPNSAATSAVAFPPAEPVTADELIGALKQIIERGHEHGLKVIGCTLTPYEGATYYSERGEQIREAVNQWIRSGGAFDAVVDFDAATRDPENPKRIRMGFNERDHLHPNDAGYEAMANAIDLSLFGVKAAASSASR